MRSGSRPQSLTSSWNSAVFCRLVGSLELTGIICFFGITSPSGDSLLWSHLPEQIDPARSPQPHHYATPRAQSSIFTLHFSNGRNLICAKYLFTSRKACRAEGGR